MDYKGIVYYELLPQGQTINREYYLGVCVKQCAKKETNLWANNSWVLYPDNASSHNAIVIREPFDQSSFLVEWATYFHPKYRSFSPYDNIGLIELTRDVSYSASVFPACLHTEPSNFTRDTELILAAWNSSLIEGSKKRLQLLSTAVKLIPNTECNEFYASVPRLRIGIDGSLICASPPVKDLCHRRLVGALHVASDAYKKNFRVVGIDAFGPTVCGTTIPDTFINLTEYLDFIESVVWPST